jgi:hypothetical protein
MSEIRLLPSAHHCARSLAVFLMVFAPFAFGALALALGQDANWDLRNYHWYNAYAFLHGRFGFDLVPAQTPTFYNPVLDAPFFLLANHVSAKAADYILGFTQGFNFVPLFMLAYASLTASNSWRKTAASAALALLGMLGGGGIALIGTTFYDNVTSLGLFASALLVIRFREWLMMMPVKRAFGLALLFGLPSGLMMGLKLPSVIFCVGFCFGILGMGGSFRRLLIISFAFGLGVLLGAAISLGYWAWFLEAHFGDPFFPYFNEIFKSPLAPLNSARDEQFIPHGFWNNLLFPFLFAKSPYMIGEIEWRDWRVPILYALLPAVIVLRLVFGRVRGKDLIEAHAARYLLGAAAITYIVWLRMFSIYRYAVPLEMLAPLLIAMAADGFPLKRPYRAALAVCLLLIVAVSVEPGNWTRRSAWLDHFVEVKVPALPDHADLMILMAGIEPYAHVIPAFPPDIPFVRIQSNFTSPERNVGFNRIIRSHVESHKGPFMLLVPSWEVSAGDEALAAYDLARAPESCQTVVDRLYDDKPLSLCRLVHTSG